MDVKRKRESIAVIINSYNRGILLTKALETLYPVLNELSIPSTVMVFDAGSTDDSMQIIKVAARQFPGIPTHIYQKTLAESGSFAHGINKGVQIVREKMMDPSFYFFYETDNAILSAKPLELALSLMRDHSDLGAVGFAVRRWNGEKAGWGRKFPTIMSFIAGQRLSFFFEGAGESPVITGEENCQWWHADIAYTSPLLVRADAWSATQGMDEDRFPFTDSDVDWCWSAQRLGWSIAILSTSEIIHDNKQRISEWSNRRVLFFHRSRYLLLEKHSKRFGSWIRPVLAARHVVEVILLAVISLWKKEAKTRLEVRLKLLKSVWHRYEGIV